MATRQEIFTSLNLAVNAWRLGNHMWNIELLLQGIDNKATPIIIWEYDEKDESKTPNTREITYQENKDMAQQYIDAIHTMADRMNFISSGVDSIFLDSGYNYLSVNRVDIEHDITETKRICSIATISEVLRKDELKLKAAPFEVHQPKFIQSISSKTSVSHKMNCANIINDLYDAMSYELQGIASNTGVAHKWSIGHLKDMITARLGTAQNYIKRLSAGADKLLFTSVGDYIEASIPGAKTLSDLQVLGKYIDINIEKLIMLRRWWAI